MGDKTQSIIPHYFLVVGLGKTGLACVRYLRSKQQLVRVADSRENPPNLATLREEFPNVPCQLGEITVEACMAANTIVLSPGVSTQLPAIQKAMAAGIRVISEIELFALSVPQNVPVIGITGSNGKSTVTSMVAAAAEKSGLKVAAGGNLGQPAISLFQDKVELYVLELSSFQLETTHSLHCKVAALLNITPDHLDQHGSFEAYQQAKLRIFNHCEFRVMSNGLDLLEKDVVTFTDQEQLDKNADYCLQSQDEQPWLCHGDNFLMPCSELAQRGTHNISNALATLAICDLAGIPRQYTVQALREFRGLPHRTEIISKQAGVLWVNDSKGTNVGATIAALKGLRNEITGKWIVILGGDDKSADLSPLTDALSGVCKVAIVMGKASNRLTTLLASTVPVVVAKDMAAAVREAKLQAKFGDGVLLSPACASQDMFEDYQHRGQVFIEEVIKG